MKTLSLFWLMLLSFFALGATGDDDTEDMSFDELADAAGGEDEDDKGDEGDPPDDDEQDASGKDDDPAVLLEAERKARQRVEVERDVERETRQREARERAAAPAPTQTRGDPEFEAEERRLAEARANKDYTAEQVKWLEWQIESTRNIRASKRESQQAMFIAADATDRNAFDKLETSKPRLHKRYADRVEKELAKARSEGRNPPRRAILAYLVGEDMVSGKIKAKSGKSTTESTGTKVDRGRMPGTRTDVGRKGGMTEHQKRAARLENQIL